MSASTHPSDPTKAPAGSLLPVFLTVFIDLLGFGIVIPLLPIYSKDFGASELTLGLLFASFSAMQLVFAPFWGRLSDRYGRRPILICGLLGTAASYVLFGLARDLPLLFTSRLLAGFFGANVATAQAYIADVTTEEDRAKGMGIIGAAFGLGFTFGPLIGGLFTTISMSMPGFIAAGLSLVAAIVGILRLPEPNRHRAETSRIFGFETLGLAWRDQRIGAILLLYFCAILAFSGFESMFIRFGVAKFPQAFGLDHSIEQATRDQILGVAPIAGWYMFAIGLMAALIQGGLIRRLVPRFGETRLIIVGPFLLGLSFLIIGMAPVWALVMVGCVIMPFGFGVNNPSLNGLLSRAVSADRQGAFLGLNQSLGSLARVLGPLLAGGAFQFAGAASPFFLSAAILFAATLLAVLYRKRFAATFVRRRAESVGLPT
jgi:DHA1 family tetracycline resistance protein-like MFS transporter